MNAQDRYSTSRQLQERARNALPRLACSATDPHRLCEWQEKARRALQSLLGLDRLTAEESLPMEVEVLERHAEECYVREKIALRTQRDQWVPAWVLIPTASQPPFPAVMCFHGHLMNKEVTIGRPRTQEERRLLELHRGDYGRHFAERGFLCFCPDARGFGERDENRGCKALLSMALANGYVLGGLRIWDHLKGLEYLLARSDVDARRIGAAGLSMGCEHAMYLSALAPQISAIVLSCCLRDLREEIYESDHCPCSFVPNLFRELDWSDVACLLAPRPLLVQQGTSDYVPMASVEAAVEKLARVYTALEARSCLEKCYFEGGHTFHAPSAAEWLAKWLGNPQPSTAHKSENRKKN